MRLRAEYGKAGCRCARKIRRLLNISDLRQGRRSQEHKHEGISSQAASRRRDRYRTPSCPTPSMKLIAGPVGRQ